MTVSATTITVVLCAITLIAFTKGAFGGGYGLLGIPLLSLVMDPVTAGALLAPLFVAMDLFALRYWRPNTWSKPEVTMLIPAMIAGIALGFVLLGQLNAHLVGALVGLISLAFIAAWLLGGGRTVVRPRSSPRAIGAGLASGVTTMIAHSGGPPISMYLLSLGLEKQSYAGTISIVFTAGNALKLLPWLLLARPGPDFWPVVLVAIPAVPIGVWIGWKLHQRISRTQLERACYILLTLTALKLLWDARLALH
jgi:uncharacterized protein